MDTALKLLAVIGLVMMNGFFVAAEFALVSARATRIDQLAEEMPGWTGRYHDEQNVGEALEWSKKQHGLEIVSLSADERKAWNAKLEPMVTQWVEEMKGKGLPAEKYVQRARELRDQLANKK